MYFARGQARQQRTRRQSQPRMPLFLERLESRAMLTAAATPDFTTEADCVIVWESEAGKYEVESALATPAAEPVPFDWYLFLNDDFQYTDDFRCMFDLPTIHFVPHADDFLYTDDSLSTEDYPEHARRTPDSWVPLALAYAATAKSDYAVDQNAIAFPPETPAIPAGMAWALSLYGVADTASPPLLTRPLRIPFHSNAFVAQEPTASEPDTTCLMPLMQVDSSAQELAADARPLQLMLSQDTPDGTLVEPLTSQLSIGLLETPHRSGDRVASLRSTTTLRE